MKILRNQRRLVEPKRLETNYGAEERTILSMEESVFDILDNKFESCLAQYQKASYP